jgi:predicted transcriptional regulator
VEVEADRRDTTRRAEVVRTVLEEIVHNSVPFITIETITKSLHVSTEAATRIIERLVSAGIVVETRTGIWIRVSP